MKIDLRILDVEKIKKILEEMSEPKYRAVQIFDWIHKKNVTSFSEMTNISKKLLGKLTQKTYISSMDLIKKQEASDATAKFLFRLADGNMIECVLMRYRGTKSKNRDTLCISTQVGCSMGCAFCATGLSGFTRNLTVGEIVGQVYAVNRHYQELEENFRVGNVVYMGMGEPLLNFDNVYHSLGLLNSSSGQNISMRRITVSTCGIVPKMRELAEKKLELTLAVSLHAPTNELRNKIMPINKRYPLEELKKACEYYVQETKRRITFEYAVIKGFNDEKRHAQELANYLRGMLCHVNLIPLNPVKQTGLDRPQKNKVYELYNELKNRGIEATIREERGKDIDAACGQLRGKVVE